MKKNVAFIFLLLSNVAIAFAQNDAAAKKLLDEVSKKYDAYTTIQSNFNFLATGQQSESYSDKGILFLNKVKNQYRIQLSTQELISDGKTAWSVLKEDKEVQISEAESGTVTIGPTNLFTFYKKGFSYRSLPEESIDNNRLNVVELTPLDSKTNYLKIKLRINKNKHIHDVLIFDKSGSRYTYTILALYVNHQIPSSKFTFNKSDYRSYEIVDLR